MASTQRLAEQAEVVDRSRTVRDLLVLRVWLVFLDLIVIEAALLFGWRLRVGIEGWLDPVARDNAVVLAAGPWIVLTWLLLLALQGAYSVQSLGAGTAEYRAVAMASVMAAGLVGLGCYMFKIPLSRGFLLLTFLVGLPLVLLSHFVVRRFMHRMRSRGRLVHRVVAVGGATGIGEVVSVLEREKYLGYQVIGACTPRNVEPDEVPVPIFGGPTDIRRICIEEGADTVLVARGGYNTAGELRRIAWALEGAGVELVVVPSLTDVAGPRIRMRPVAGLPLIHLQEPQAGEAGGFGKRAFDIVLSLAALVVLSPAMVACALLVRREDGGPVLFRQPRVGRTGQLFDMLKFRSMVVDAEARRAELVGQNEGAGVLFKMREDPRITRVGRVLRRYSLDELPQLLNVLKGDMSLVGPRPPLQDEVDRYHDDMRRRLLVRPGITGLWQVSGRSELSWDESVRLDLYYVDNWSMLSDLVILAKTVRAVVGSSGAY
ncbi:sugar transferase [Nocardioides iriomotensis]|uniref:sugar transferase n=1 Tax=Nocardioides iriomotensis TaxID=715784 RepID=UPI0019814CB2|nr:sugar transferase [Nocardioides iriomotensis]